MSKQSSKGRLEVIIGPIFSGKTSELIKRIQRYYFAGYKCIVIRFTSDDKCRSDLLITHDGYKINGVLTSSLLSVQKFVEEFDVIGIDEGHKFTDLEEFCSLASDNNKKVIVAALDSNEVRQGIAHVLNLIPLAESVNKLTSICKSCCNEVPFVKKIEDKSSKVEEDIAVKFVPICDECFLVHSSTKTIN